MWQKDVQIFGDGAFQYCAIFFISYIHFMPSRKDSMYYVCISFFHAKKKECYIEMFQFLLDVCTQKNLELNITYLNLYFEYAAHVAARQFWPDVAHQGISIPFGSSLVQKKTWINKWMQRSGISSRTVVENIFFGFSFLDPEKVEGCFVFDIFSEASGSVVNSYIDKSSTFLPSQGQILMLNAKEPPTDVKASTRNSESCFTVYTPIFLTV